MTSSHTTFPEEEANSFALGTLDDLNSGDHGQLHKLLCTRLGSTLKPCSSRPMPRKPGITTTWIESMLVETLQGNRLVGQILP